MIPKVAIQNLKSHRTPESSAEAGGALPTPLAPPAPPTTPGAPAAPFAAAGLSRPGRPARLTDIVSSRTASVGLGSSFKAAVPDATPQPPEKDSPNPSSTPRSARHWSSPSPSSLPTPQLSEPRIHGIDAVNAEFEVHGIKREHLEKLSELADKYGYVFAVRPVNRFASMYIDAGNPTKGLKIKGKSADWGPMAGLIPFDQKLSKKAGADPELIAKANAEVVGCVNNKFAAAIPLTLTETQIKKLVEDGAMQIEGDVNDSTDAFPMNITATKSGQSYSFTGKLQLENAAGGTEKVFSIYRNNEPVKVLAMRQSALGFKKESPRAFTADYDLLLFAPHLEAYGKSDIAHESPMSRRAQAALARTTSASDSVENDADNSDPEVADESLRHADRGVISQRLNLFIDEINASLGCAMGYELVQHGPDTENPYSSFDDNVPSVFFGPGKNKNIDQSGEEKKPENEDPLINLNGVWMALDAREAAFSSDKIKTLHQFNGNAAWIHKNDESPIVRQRPSFSLAAEELSAWLTVGRPPLPKTLTRPRRKSN